MQQVSSLAGDLVQSLVRLSVKLDQYVSELTILLLTTIQFQNLKPDESLLAFSYIFGKHSAHKNHSAIITTHVLRIERKVSLK